MVVTMVMVRIILAVTGNDDGGDSSDGDNYGCYGDDNGNGDGCYVTMVIM